jgi:hypothetical protein
MVQDICSVHYSMLVRQSIRVERDELLELPIFRDWTQRILYYAMVNRMTRLANCTRRLVNNGSGLITMHRLAFKGDSALDAAAPKGRPLLI